MGLRQESKAIEDLVCQRCGSKVDALGSPRYGYIILTCRGAEKHKFKSAYAPLYKPPPERPQ